MVGVLLRCAALLSLAQAIAAVAMLAGDVTPCAFERNDALLIHCSLLLLSVGGGGRFRCMPHPTDTYNSACESYSNNASKERPNHESRVHNSSA